MPEHPIIVLHARPRGWLGHGRVDGRRLTPGGWPTGVDLLPRPSAAVVAQASSTGRAGFSTVGSASRSWRASITGSRPSIERVRERQLHLQTGLFAADQASHDRELIRSDRNGATSRPRRRGAVTTRIAIGAAIAGCGGDDDGAAEQRSDVESRAPGNGAAGRDGGAPRARGMSGSDEGLDATPIELTTADDISLYAVRAGAGNSSVVFAHEGRDNLCGRVPQARRLADAGFRVLLFDLRGNGQSPTPDDHDAAVGPRPGRRGHGRTQGRRQARLPYGRLARWGGERPERSGPPSRRHHQPVRYAPYKERARAIIVQWLKQRS